MDFEKASKEAYRLMSEIPRDERGNPLTLDGAIRSIILKSPLFAPYRDQSLGILYTLLGAGVEWIDGRIGDSHPNNYMNMPPRAGGQGVWVENDGMEESIGEIFGDESDPVKLLIDQFAKQWRNRQREAVAAILNIDTRCQEYSPEPKPWYPISWLGCRLCAPANAAPDFFDGAVETATLIVDQEPPYGTEAWRTHLRTKQRAEQALQSLLLKKRRSKV